jgi:5'-3' exoribonuclease 1
MGIPSYFSHIIKNHPNILRTLAHHRETKFTALYMDCNSIIYDAVRTFESGEKSDAFQDKLIDQVIRKIKQYISIINPSRIAYISFDGVAPLAKMDQQKERRYRSAYLAEVLNTESSNIGGFSTTAITPGTEFMVNLSARVNVAFSKESGVVVSAADEPGEGEHKMFSHLRQYINRKDVVAVYGLDADLIMLSMFHCFHCFNIHIFREAPEFSAHILPAGLKARNKSDLLFVDTFKFSRSLLDEMGFGKSGMTPYQLRGRIYDYVFMCFMLGNDFMPHFLALNIRTAGIGRLIDTYNVVIAKYPERSFISANMTIRWKCVWEFISALAKNEHGFIKEEMAQRAKTAKGIAQSTSANSLKTAQDREAALMNIPMLFREDEEYINPGMENWQKRYYDVAFHSAAVDVHAVCRNYCEGLEWTFRYYTTGCPHWQWKYAHSYPPLLQDLAVYMSNLEDGHIYFGNGDAEIHPFSPTEQLLYVLPKTHHYLLPEGTVVDSAAYPDMDKLQFSWMGCRYFWESHLVS